MAEIFGPEGYGGVKGTDGEITVIGNALAAKIARWQIRRTGSHRDGTPKLTFKAWFSWRNDTLMGMCEKGIFKARIRVFMLGKKGREQIDIVNWESWELNVDGMLTLDDVLSFDTSPITTNPR